MTTAELLVPPPPADKATVPAARPAAGPAPLLEAVRAIAQGELADQAEAVDRGRYPREVMQALGAAGAYRAHLAPGAAAGDYMQAIRAMAEVSRVCGATGFMVWCQQVCGLYLQQSGNPALMGRVLAEHASGQRLAAPA